MLNTLNLVQGDDLPYVNLVLTKGADNTPLDISDPNIVVRVFFKSALKKATLSTIICEKVLPAEGKVRFNFSGGVLNVPPGTYFGEIEIDFKGQTLTIFDTLKFTVRAQF